MAVYKVLGANEHQKYTDEVSYETVIRYIFSHARFIGGMGIQNLRTAAQEMLNHAKACGKNSGKRLRHSMLSFDPEEKITAEKAKSIADTIIQYYGMEYQIVYAVHNDPHHVHIHFVMNQIGWNGKRYRGEKADYYGFRNWMRLACGCNVITVNE